MKKLTRNELRSEVVQRLRKLPGDKLPKNIDEFAKLVDDHYDRNDTLTLFKDMDDIREWIFDTCLESGRFETNDGGDDLRIKA